jgi:purine-binding chemotaxis protein CheW
MVTEHEGEAERTKLVCFLLQGQEYAADIHFVKESLTLRPITRVALTPGWLAGVINLRGDVVAIIDLSLFLTMPQTQTGTNTRIVVARHEGRRVGFLCDKLCDLRTLDLGAMQVPPTTLDSSSTSILSGVLTLDGGHALRVLDLGALFESPELASFRRGDSA